MQAQSSSSNLTSTLDQIRNLALVGVGRRNVEAVIGHMMSPGEMETFRRAQTEHQLAVAAKKARGPMSVAERVRKHVAAKNDLGDFDTSPRHPRLRESCKYNLERFGWYYCRSVLRHRASQALREGLITDVQNAILAGGKTVKEYGRGTGKTTWIALIGVVWAALYGHRRYTVLISATAKLARKNLKSVKRLLARSNAILADFPEVAVAIRALGDISQRTASQTYRGQPTDSEWSGDQIVLPMLRDEFGQPLSPACGAIVGSVGIGGAVRGANEGGQRPDFLIFDDPQTKKIAHSPKLTQDVIDYIHQDALQLGGHDRTISAFVTITPQCFGDVATELTSQSKHPEWSTSIEPFVSNKCQHWDDLLADFVLAYVDDAANHDYHFTRSTKWYLDNRAKFAGVTVIDPEQYDHVNEVDAIHHVLNLRASLGAISFDAEIMLQVADVSSDLRITADTVCNALNGAPRGVCPVGTDSAVGFVDINTQKGSNLSWGIVAFGPGRVAALVAYGRYPERGPLVPPNSPTTKRDRLVSLGIRAVIQRIRELKLRDTKGRRIIPRAVGFDRGYLPDVVHRTLWTLKRTQPCEFLCIPVRGCAWNKFGLHRKRIKHKGDHIQDETSQYGDHLAMMSPYWREIMQASFLETPLMPGSLSIYGNNNVEHFELAQEVAAEKLIRKYAAPTATGRSETAWDWACNGPNHYCDVLTGCFALASYYNCYDALSSVIDAAVTMPVAAANPPHVVHQDDLFDPRINAELSKPYQDLAEPDATGTRDGEPDLPEVAHPPMLIKLPRPKPTIPRRTRGKWKKGR